MSRILIAEDDPHILRLMSMWLRRQGYEVVEARNGLRAREFLEAEVFDVLVSDVNMPGMDGLGLVKYASTHQRVRCGAVVFTNRWDHGDLRDQLGGGGVTVMPKPFSPSKLAELVGSLTSGVKASTE